MIYASKELSQKLYDLSGWGDTHKHYGKMESGNYIASCGLFEKHQDIPAYDLGYLRQKILDELDLKWPDSLQPTIYYPDLSVALLNGEDDLAEFAISLFEDEVLSP